MPWSKAAPWTLVPCRSIYGAQERARPLSRLTSAYGRPSAWNWRGFKVRPGTVLYVAAEGGGGLAERLAAFRIHHELETAEGVPFYVIPEPIDLCRSTADADLLLKRITELPPEDPPLVLIVVDTLSRAMAGGNENSPDDMGKFVANLDRIRLTARAHTLVIHHSGKDDTRGARGHSLLRAAADTEIEVTKTETGEVTMSVAKQRDMPDGQVFGFRLKQDVDLGDGQKGAVLINTEEGFAKRSTEKKKRRLPPAATIALRALREALDEMGKVPPASLHIPSNTKVVSGDVWRRYAYDRGISGSDQERARQQAFKRASEALLAGQYAAMWQDQAWLV